MSDYPEHDKLSAVKDESQAMMGEGCPACLAVTTDLHKRVGSALLMPFERRITDEHHRLCDFTFNMSRIEAEALKELVRQLLVPARRALELPHMVGGGCDLHDLIARAEAATSEEDPYGDDA